MFVSEEIIKRLNQFIDVADWSKASFARNMNKPPSNIHKYFNGTADIQLISYDLLMHGCNIIWLYTGEGDMFADNANGDELREEYLIRNKNIYTSIVDKENEVTSEPKVEYKQEKELVDANEIRGLIGNMEGVLLRLLENQKK